MNIRVGQDDRTVPINLQARKPDTLQSFLLRSTGIDVDISQPFIRLPFAFDANRLADEILALPDAAWMSHPSDLKGNSAVALISRDGGDNNDFEGAMSETPHLQACPYMRQVLASFGEVFGRSRLMKLTPGAEVSQHVDFNYHWYTRVRIHVPVITNPGVTFYCADQDTHMRAGECWIFNSWRRHRVTNDSDEERVHLVIDTAGSSRFWTLVRKMDQLHYVTDAAEIDSLTKAVPYREGAEAVIHTEQYNVTPVMSPGEVDALVDGVIGEFQDNPNNDSAIVHEYRTLLLDFAKDWREIWHLHGYGKKGWPKYQQAIDAVLDGLHSNPRTLVTQSNEVGVNPVIVQRVLGSALVVEQLDRFTSRVEPGS